MDCLICTEIIQIHIELFFARRVLSNLAIVEHAMFTVEICYPRQIIVWIKPFVTSTAL